jgi:uncharacterized repeat protein (TIGR01451 family)
LALVALLVLLVASAALMVGTASASAAVILNADSGGQNDVDPSSLNNQSDLSAYGISGTGAANTTTQYGWKWDEPFLSGNNSLDVCVYLSSTTSGTSDPNAAEYAVCYDVTTDSEGNPTTTNITYWYCPTYSTADASSGGQKCFGSSSELPAGPDSAVISATAALTTNVAPQFASDPDRDTQVVLDVTANLNLTLVNICSKKSASPSSDSSDCGLERAPAFLKLVKSVQDGDAVPADWTLSWDGPGTNDGSVAGDNTQFVPVPDGTYNLSESGPSTYEQVSLVCSPTANTGNSVTLGQGVQETCTFTNKLKFIPNPHLSITKTATEANYDAVGDVINYTIVATNDGNTTLTGVTVSDPKVSGLDCTPTNGSDLAPGASISCTASHTVTQDDIDAGNYANTACVNDGDGGAAEACADEDVPAVQNPRIGLTKTPNPTTYSAAGQIISYTLVATNTGNVTLHDVTVTDSKLGTLTCTPTQPSTLAPGSSMSCTGSYTIQPGDVKADNTGTVVNTANTAGKGPQDQPVSNTATATVRQVPATGKITPTATTCQQFANGTNGDLTDELYTVKGNKINSISPGVFFYYSKITAPASAFTIEVKQSNTLNWRQIGTQQLILWDRNCVKTFVSGSYNSITGTVTFNASGLTSGAIYYISIKYDPGSLSGQTVGNTKPTSVYTFKTYINGGVVLTSQDGLNVKAK